MADHGEQAEHMPFKKPLLIARAPATFSQIQALSVKYCLGD